MIPPASDIAAFLLLLLVWHKTNPKRRSPAERPLKGALRYWDDDWLIKDTRAAVEHCLLIPRFSQSMSETLPPRL